MKKILFVLLAVCGITASAQNDSINKPFNISGYAEVYYTADFNNPKNNNRPGFVYSHNRNNEINVNLAYIKTAYNTENVRANLALAVGTYMNANYAAEQGVMKNVYEANAGLKISKSITYGLMPEFSHRI